MQIYKVKDLYVIKGYYNGRYFAITGQSMLEALDTIFSEIAIFRSLTAWNR